MEVSASRLETFLAENGLTVSLSPSKGRCLLASRRFQRGAELLEQEPYVTVLDASSQEQRCDGCYRLSGNLKRCSACKSVWYCCTACQRKEWRLHQDECKALVRIFKEKQRTPTSSLRMMLRLLIKRKLQSDGVVSRTAVDCYELVEALPTHMAEMGEERLVLYAQMANLVGVMVASDEVEVKDITENFCRFACNATQFAMRS